MVTDTYAQSFDSDRKLIAQEMDSGFFSKIEEDSSPSTVDDTDIKKLRKLVRDNPSLLAEFLAEKKIRLKICRQKLTG